MSNNNKISKEEANKLLTKILNEAKAKIQEAQELADKHGLYFQSPIERYGMGGAYYSEKFKEENDWGWNSSNSGWVSSSEGC